MTAGRLAVALFALSLVAGTLLHIPVAAGTLLIAAGLCAMVWIGRSLDDRDTRGPGV
jgi:hypothetical protein